MRKKLILFAFIFIIVGGCASPFKPSPSVVAIMNGMSEAQATDEIQKHMQPKTHNGKLARSFISGYIGLGLCKAYQIKPDDEQGLDLQVTKAAISFNAIKTGKLVKRASPGNIPSVSGMALANQYEHIAYREYMNFDMIEAVTVNEPNLLRTNCSRQSGQTEVVLRESPTHWYVALIPTDEKERFIAALLRLRPDINISTESQDNSWSRK